VSSPVPGPRQPVYALGRRAVEIVPYVPIASTLRFGISIFSYCDQVTFGITGDRDTTGDIEVLARGIADSLAELVAAARQHAIRAPSGGGRVGGPGRKGVPPLPGGRGPGQPQGTGAPVARCWR
jgi:WS/DGAT C-terminal domain